MTGVRERLCCVCVRARVCVCASVWMCINSIKHYPEFLKYVNTNVFFVHLFKLTLTGGHKQGSQIQKAEVVYTAFESGFVVASS